ncbi:MAG: PKD domain-containing protein [Bacteroidia bacterium]|nr:PKD domain-containing protein [Bacteroidia bacterium]MCC6767422.1 PKD domain-containing protein [Bacteroidia bacterium]
MIKHLRYSWVFLVLSHLHAVAQPALVWAGQLGAKDNITSARSDKGSGIVTDVDGNVYLTGNFWGKADFDPGAGTYYLQSVGASDVFVCKLSKAGQLVWAIKIGGSNYHNSNALTIDKEGHLYITGYLQGATTYPPAQTIQPIGYKDAFVCKLDTSGQVIWLKQLGGMPTSMDQNEGMAIAVDDSGNVYSAGIMYYSSGGIDLDPGPAMHYLNNAGDLDCYISKLNKQGEFVWGKRIGGTRRELVNALGLDAQGNCYITGSFTGLVDFDPGDGQYPLSASISNSDAFVCKLSSAGNFQWAKQFGGASSAEAGRALSIDRQGDVIVAGVFGGTVDFNPDTGTFHLTGTNASTFISKFSGEGGFKWARHFYGRNQANGLCTDQRSNIYLCGQISSGTNNPTDFDPGQDEYNVTLPYNSPDIYIAKLDSAGWFLSAGTLGGQNGVAINTGLAIATDAFEHLYVTGEYAGLAPDFDPAAGSTFMMPTTNMDDEDIFVGKYRTISAPEVQFSSQRQAICPDNCIIFTNESTDASAWRWYFEGGVPAYSELREPGAVCYPDTGNFRVELIATLSGLSDTLVREAYINVTSINSSFSISPGNYTYGFHAEQDSLAGISYAWSFGDGAISSLRSPVYSYKSAGEYEVCLTITRDSLCSNSSCSNVEAGITGLPAPKQSPVNWRYSNESRQLICEGCPDGLYLVEVYDISGRLVMQPGKLQCINGITNLDLSNTKHGAVIIRVYDNRQVVSVLAGVVR